MSETIKSEEFIKSTKERLDFVSIRPGGNNTGLVLSKIGDLMEKKKINDLLMSCYPNIEQVGFIFVNNNNLNLEMAGGEFCGNATRSATFLALDGKVGDLQVKVSGVNSLLKAGVKEDGEAYAQMPVYEDLSKINQDPENPNAWLVEMEGISHYLIFQDSIFSDNTNIEQTKKEALEIIKKKGLLNFSAAGVIKVSKDNNEWRIDPVVYVKNINTCFYETACGSGTTALGEVLAVLNNASIQDVPVRQPSGEIIKVGVELVNKKIKYAEISGQVELLNKGIIKELKNNKKVIIEIVSGEKSLKKCLFEEGLISLYQKIFADFPYFEQFDEAEVDAYFEDYLSNGKVLIARDKGKIVGFAAAYPFVEEPIVRGILIKQKINPDDCSYIAELGVDSESRGNGIGQALIEELLLELPNDKNPVLRTNINNEVAQKLYQRLGFYIIPGAIETVRRNRTEGAEIEDQRLFMIKSLLNNYG